MGVRLVVTIFDIPWYVCTSDTCRMPTWLQPMGRLNMFRQTSFKLNVKLNHSFPSSIPQDWLDRIPEERRPEVSRLLNSPLQYQFYVLTKEELLTSSGLSCTWPTDALFALAAAQVLFLAVPNMQAPSVEQAQRFLDAVSGRGEGQDNAVVVHCGGGKGRAGTLLALAMMARRMGQGWRGVIDKLREMRSETSCMRCGMYLVHVSLCFA